MSTIVQLTKEDLNECSELYVSVFNSSPWNDQWDTSAALRRLTDIYNTPNFIGVVLKEDGVIQGAVFGNFEYFYDGIHFNLKEMFVNESIQGKGYGSKLLQELELQLKERDVRMMILFTSKQYKTRDFYLKNQFEEFTTMCMMGKDL